MERSVAGHSVKNISSQILPLTSEMERSGVSTWSEHITSYLLIMRETTSWKKWSCKKYWLLFQMWCYQQNGSHKRWKSPRMRVNSFHRDYGTRTPHSNFLHGERGLSFLVDPSPESTWGVLASWLTPKRTIASWLTPKEPSSKDRQRYH